ncbi:cupin domain-containing protein [Mycolicibacterium sp. 050158]|uniref:cupin domain-containing protein n=1 Tax=Mycolicibacterium sp. 050158 TaxID=3090602 RepID=UPI00299E71D3|nr:cupin domain-containing protein [Mycolicibacterium sp. 050158]MDX1892081.1 cupin domain-containing protein [Mycolicibacterium sp. 050158]
MINAYRLCTGPDGNSHVERESIAVDPIIGAKSLLFKETAAHSSLDWHNGPTPQYVITLSGVLEFTTVGGDTFTIRPGDVLLATDHTGTGHRWRLIDTHFVPDRS